MVRSGIFCVTGQRLQPFCHCEERQRRSNLKKRLLRFARNDNVAFLRIKMLLFCCLTMLFLRLNLCFGSDVDLMDKFSPSGWISNGAGVSYNNTTREIRIAKDTLRLTPNWGSVKLELGSINISDPQENYLYFEVTDIDGSYSLLLHYGGREQYDSHFIKIQNVTDFEGPCKYNLSQALRNNGLEGNQEIQIEFIIIDTDTNPGNALMIIRKLIFGYDDNFAISSPQ